MTWLVVVVTLYAIVRWRADKDTQYEDAEKMLRRYIRRLLNRWEQQLPSEELNRRMEHDTSPKLRETVKHQSIAQRRTKDWMSGKDEGSPHA